MQTPNTESLIQEKQEIQFKLDKIDTVLSLIDYRINSDADEAVLVAALNVIEKVVEDSNLLTTAT